MTQNGLGCGTGARSEAQKEACERVTYFLLAERAPPAPYRTARPARRTRTNVNTQHRRGRACLGGVLAHSRRRRAGTVGNAATWKIGGYQRPRLKLLLLCNSAMTSDILPRLNPGGGLLLFPFA
jgi:hypothetical protein